MAAARQLPAQKLREFLRSDAPAREASAARFMSMVALAVLPMALGLGPVIGWSLSALLVAVIGPFAAYQLGVLWLIRRGRYRTWMSWVNVLIETSIPCAIVSVDLAKQGPVYALTSPPIAIWSALIMFSVLRASRSLAVTAGAVAAAEYLVFYFVFARPLLPADAVVTLRPAMMLIRAFLLLCAGGGGAVLAHHLLRKAEQALSAVRAQDLMSKYFLHEPLGAGGMAEVFRATYSPEGGFERVVAIKRVLPTYSNDPYFTELFRFEAQLCARLSHPNIVQVTDVGRFDGQYILAMEYIDGLSLHALLRQRGALPPAAVAYLGAELASALDYLHRRTDDSGQPLRLVHRDVNPPNVLISRIGEVKLSDFGVAHAATRKEKGGIVGKPSYLSPEQARREPLDGRADLFCLGLTLHEALTGKRVLHGRSREETIESVFEPPPAIRALAPEVPAELEALVLELLAQDRENRPASGRELRARLLELPGSAAPFPLGQQQFVAAVEASLGARAATPHPDQATAISIDATLDSKPRARSRAG